MVILNKSLAVASRPKRVQASNVTREGNFVVLKTRVRILTEARFSMSMPLPQL